MENKKHTNKLVKLAGFLVCFILMQCVALNSIAFAMSDEGFITEPEAKVYSDATIDQNFDGSSVLVIMDKNTGGINKKLSNSIFRKL